MNETARVSPDDRRTRHPLPSSPSDGTMRPAGCFSKGARVRSHSRASASPGSLSTQDKVEELFAIDGRQNGGGDKVRVTFSSPPIEGCDSLHLVGWFDEWKESAFPMQRREDGGWELTLELDRGCEYLYRFRTEDGVWLRDPSTPAGSALFGLNTSFYLGDADSGQGNS